MNSKMETNEGSSTNIEDLRRLEKALKRAADYMEIQTRPEDTIIFIGPTRSGKSSLINYIIGNKLIGEKVSQYKPIVLKKTNDNFPGPQIGIGATSETAIPSRWVSDKFPGVGLWDLPGFSDNRGVIQDITNAFYINELFKNIKSAKIVLVIDIHDIENDSIRQFLTLLNSLEGMLQEKMRECFSGIGVIFAKVPDSLHDNQVDKNLITGILKEQLLSSSDIDISESIKEFVGHLIRNDQIIGFFKKAIEGEITETTIDSGIIEAIQNINSIRENILKNVSTSIAPASKVFLFEVREKLSSMEVFNELQKLVVSIFEEKLNYIETMKEAEPSREKLFSLFQELSVTKDNMEKALAPVTTFHTKIAEIKMIDPAIGRFIDEQNLVQKAELMEFIDKLLNLTEAKLFDINLHSIILTAMSKVSEILIWIKLQLGEIDIKEAEAQVSRIKEEYERDIRQIRGEAEVVRLHNDNERRRMGPFGNLGCAIDDCFEMISRILFFRR